MKTGSIFTKIIFPYPWPVPKDRILMESEDNGVILAIKALSSGALSFTVLDKLTETVQYTSPTLMISGHEPITSIIAFAWEENQPTKMYVNGAQVGHEPVNLTPLPRKIEADPISTRHPKKNYVCAEYVKSRKQAFSSQAECAAGRIKLTTKQQLEQLQRVIAALIGLLVEVDRGRDHFIGHIATDLRAILYYKISGQFVRYPYNPLLLRLAGVHNIDLPVYFVRAIPKNKLGLIEEATHFVEDPLISTIRLTETQRIGDLSECLEQRVIRINLAGAEPQMVSLNKVICAASSTIGSAHYDDTIPLEVNFIQNLIVGTQQGPILKKIILDLAKVTAELSKYVIEEIRVRQGLC